MAKKKSTKSAMEIPGDPAKPWLKCKSYKLENVTNNGTSCKLDFSAKDEKGKEHGFSVTLPSTNPKLARDMFRAVVLWPKCDFEFQSDANGAVGTITAFR
jgi:hypothetical protein